MILYDLILFFITLLISLKKPHHFRRLFAKIPDPKDKFVIWIHAVSVGETKAAGPFFKALKEKYPTAFFLITTTTATGLAEAKRELSQADAFSYLPVDLSFIIKRWVQKLQPKLFFLVEGDFWPNLLTSLKKSGALTVLVSGKISQKSASRFTLFPKLFRNLDQLYVQNEEYERRFRQIADPCRIQITGNLKQDIAPGPVDIPLELLIITKPTITIACTHDPEEEKLLSLISDDYLIFLAPRHPERFEKVAHFLARNNIPFCLWSDLANFKGDEKVLLVNAMGKLPICYSLSRLAIVAGSFESHLEGHNILEPCLYDIPVLFGPYMESQKELVSKVLKAKAGMQISYKALPQTLQDFFQNPSQEKAMQTAAKNLIAEGRGATSRTMDALNHFLSC